MYTIKNDISQIYNKFKDWVQATIDHYSTQNLEQILDTLQQLPKITDPELTLHGKLELANAVIHKLDTWAVKTPSLNLDNHLVEKINRMHVRIEHVKERVKYLEGILTPHKEHVEVAYKKERPPVGDQIKEIEETTTVKVATVVQETLSHVAEAQGQVTTEDPPEVITENDFVEATQEEIVNEVIEVGDLYIKKNLVFTTINQRLGSKIIHTDTEKSLDLPTTKIKVNGDVVINDRLFVSDRIDNVKFVTENLLLKHGNQLIISSLNAEKIKTDKLFTPFINHEPTLNFLDRIVTENVAQNREVVHYDEIVAEEFYVNGFFNDMDIRIFDTLLLKPEGDQVIEAPYAIETLKANDVVLIEGSLSGKTSHDLVSVRDGTFVVDSTVQFVHPIHAENLIVSERVNNIHVQEGRMDVLLKEANYTQVRFLVKDLKKNI